MATVTVRNLPDEVHRALRVRAATHGRSTEAEIRDILEATVRAPVRVRLGSLPASVARGAGVLLPIRLDRVGDPAFAFLTWNLFLAWIPFLLAICVAAVHARGGPRVLLWVLGAGWLLFLPNAPYILTDFIHLGRVGGAPLWFDTALIGTFAPAGLPPGLGSLLVVPPVVGARAGRVFTGG